LKNFNSANDIASIPDSFYDELHNLSHGKFSLIKFNKLKTLASNSIGESNHYLSTQLLCLINLYTNIDSQIDNLDQQISTSIKELNPKYLSIPGVGELSAAIIYSEYGDLSKFDSPAQMLSFAGLEPGYFQSGTSSFTGHMVKHGSSHLRYTLMNLSCPLMLFNPCFAKYYQKKRDEGKPHRVACSHLVKKFLRVIFTLEKKNLTFDKSLLV
jgi:transposase